MKESGRKDLLVREDLTLLLGRRLIEKERAGVRGMHVRFSLTQTCLVLLHFTLLCFTDAKVSTS